MIWKRGPQTDESGLYDINEYETDCEIDDFNFTRVSTFHVKDNVAKPKICEFQVILHETNKNHMIAFKNDHNMAEFINKKNAR